MLISFAKDPVEILTPTITTDDRNNPVKTWPATGTQVTGLYVPGTANEAFGGRETSTSVDSLYLPTGTAITTGDRVKVAGHTFEVNGEPLRFTSPAGAASHVLVAIRRHT